MVFRQKCKIILDIANFISNNIIAILIMCICLWQDAADVYNPKEVIPLPVYYSAERDHIIAHIDVPCGGNQSQWLQCGAALFLRDQ